MALDVTQWLVEIRTLQRQLTEMSQERDTAYASAANWRKLYETEAQQRRIETQQFRRQITALQSEIERFKRQSLAISAVAVDRDAIKQQVNQLHSVSILQSKLMETLMQCESLSQALKAEQIDHAKTRKNLTTALGDAIDILSKDQSASMEATSDSASG